MKNVVLGTGLSGLIGQRFQEMFSPEFHCENLDLSTGVDITDAAAVMQQVSTSTAATIMHLAAYTNVSEAHNQAGDKDGVCYQVNVIGTQNIADAAKAHGKHLIHISTDFVFDGKKQTPYTEADEPNPIEWYGQTKLWAEEAVKQTLPEEQYVILRLAYPYQAQPSRPDFLASIVSKVQANTLPPAFTDHIVTPTFADDFCNVLRYCVLNQPTGLYHATGSSWHSDYDIASLVAKALNLTGDIQMGSLAEYQKSTSRPYQQTMKVSNQKLQEQFKIKMKTFPEGIAAVKSQLSQKAT